MSDIWKLNVEGSTFERISEGVMSTLTKFGGILRLHNSLMDSIIVLIIFEGNMVVE